MIYDDIDTDTEAIETLRRDADLEMAQWDAAGRAIDAARKAGRCTHLGTVGYVGKVFYPEQEGLKPGQLACTEHTNGCNAVFGSDDEWYAAMDDAVDG